MLASRRVLLTTPASIKPTWTHSRDLVSCVLNASYSHDARGVLVGKKIAIKDNIVTKDAPTTASSAVLGSYTSPFDATVVRLLKEQGVEIAHKTELDEFGMGSHTQTAHKRPLQSLYRRNGRPLSPGGSSGGSAIAVATGQAWAALGTDTGGSVRLPAAYTGVVGFKPSYGLLSRWGVIQYANSLDTVGVLSSDVASARHIFQALNVYDARDPSSLTVTTRRRIAEGSRTPPTRLRIGVTQEYVIDEMSAAVRETWRAALGMLQDAGHVIQSVSLPTTKQALSAYYVLAPAEASSNLAKYDGIRYGQRASRSPSDEATLPLYARARSQGFGDEVKRRILLGAYSLSSEAIDNYFIQAQKVRRLVQMDFNKVFAKQSPLFDEYAAGDVDVLLTPTAPTLPPTLEEVKKQSATEAYMNDVFTVPASLAGLPAISIPANLHTRQVDAEDVPCIGLQVVGQFGDDDNVLNIAEAIHSLVS